MQKQLFDVKALTAFMSQKSVFDFVNAAENDKEKHERIEQMKHKFLSGQSNFSSVNFAADNFHAPPVNFAADMSDFGNPSGVYEADDYEDYSRQAKAEFAIQQIRRLTLSSTIKDNLKEWILKRNAITKRNRERKAEQQKAFAERY